MKRWLAAVAAVCLCWTGSAWAEAGIGPVAAASAVLMEKETGEVLYAQAPHDKLEPASVTKTMTLLLVMEALDSGQLTGEDRVRVSARAASMGGSQVYLKEGETMTVHDLIKAVAVASGNDAAVALAEHLAGSESAFVARMNQRAAELGMGDTTFQNCTGLPAAGHLTSAWDIALMSRELILRHPGIRAYTTIWMDTLRDGAFQLTNTNKLIRFYDGATGLKTGFTDQAKYCISATAERDGMELIAVIMGAESSELRTEAARTLLDYGFAGYALQEIRPPQALPPVEVLMGRQKWVQPVPAEPGHVLVEKSRAKEVETTVTLCGDVEAPVVKGQKLGELTVTVAGEPRRTVALVAAEEVPRLTLWEVCRDLLRGFFMNEQ